MNFTDADGIVHYLSYDRELSRGHHHYDRACRKTQGVMERVVVGPDPTCVLCVAMDLSTLRVKTVASLAADFPRNDRTGI